ncbi:hypothetical protein BU26DRAFT_523923 [Trematosphaeria pertusa]|uniref:gamma-glutamylcyclotransferase n=1 Tax=Trematosphaeria pertusa TaxID=390896 RepID=A0A6A6HYG3_9PLEO|nr:uncharacterized protein BU26DRAFT_523923 [Trematosphaeria pertusa]KAF2242929.1 hypothetical protein BU26DRAFT_523923 [Trematosphaeria pertusa]
MAPKTPSSSPTIYFGYGSNLWLHQMSIRCPASTYLGVARLPAYRWIINDRGYANVVAVSSSSPSSSAPSPPPSSTNTNKSPYSSLVFGLVYRLSPSDEAALDRNEGVPIAYNKETLECDFWAKPPESSGEGEKVDVAKPPTETKEMLVYIDRQRTAEDKPKKEYIYRMNRGIEDAVRMGVPEGYVEDVMRKFIPEEGKAEKRKSMEEFAHRQAMEFSDESGVWTEERR